MENSRYMMDLKFLEENLDRVMEESIAAGETPGAVVVVLRGESQYPAQINTAFQKAYGNRAVTPNTEPATLDTIYDLASLTKPMVTATCIMKLVEQGKLRLSDRVSKYIPEWKNGAGDEVNNNSPGEKNSSRESITIRHLLSHTSGLKSYERFYEKYPDGNAHDQIVADIARSPINPVGEQFVYSDLGFIVLGDIVQRVSGMPLDQFAAQEIFRPLNMTDTFFNPPADKLDRVAPTDWRIDTTASGNNERQIIRGKVHDGNALVQGGVSGHAGLFSTAKDVSTFCRMMLQNGHGPAPGQRVLSPLTIAAMIKDHANLEGSDVKRGLGWDISSPYDSQRGNLFQGGYGHTGFTGTSIWMVPEEKLAVIILSNRVHPEGKGDVVGLRSRIANIVAGSIIGSYKDYRPE